MKAGGSPPASSPLEFWSAPRLWAGETCFIICGGPSVLDVDLDRLRGRKTIAINASYKAAPWADILFFGDTRFWQEHRIAIDNFAGMVVTCSPIVRVTKFRRMRKVKPPGLSKNPFELVMNRTSVSAALDLATHLGVARTALVGCDGGPAPDGRTHHHKPHPWPPKAGCWDEQRADLLTLVGPLKKRGNEVFNLSLKSRHDFWPRMTLDAFLDFECAGPAALSDTSATIGMSSFSPA